VICESKLSGASSKRMYKNFIQIGATV